jgi:hypothetical protein
MWVSCGLPHSLVSYSGCSGRPHSGFVVDWDDSVRKGYSEEVKRAARKAMRQCGRKSETRQAK